VYLEEAAGARVCTVVTQEGQTVSRELAIARIVAKRNAITEIKK
jgi:hypothetical protein